MATIYEDIETLKTRMDAIESVVGAAFAADKWFPIHCTFLID